MSSPRASQVSFRLAIKHVESQQQLWDISASAKHVARRDALFGERSGADYHDDAQRVWEGRLRSALEAHVQAGQKNDGPSLRHALEPEVIRASFARAQRWREEAPVSVRVLRNAAPGFRGMGLSLRLPRGGQSK